MVWFHRSSARPGGPARGRTISNGRPACEMRPSTRLRWSFLRCSDESASEARRRMRLPSRSR
eukprot:904152-Lingulodinium_polyedra.AAC.1